jgi:hypothetical protein
VVLAFIGLFIMLLRMGVQMSLARAIWFRRRWARAGLAWFHVTHYGSRIGREEAAWASNMTGGECEILDAIRGINAYVLACSRACAKEPKSPPAFVNTPYVQACCMVSEKKRTCQMLTTVEKWLV